LNYPPPRGRSCYPILGGFCKLQEGIEEPEDFSEAVRPRREFSTAVARTPKDRLG